MNDPTPRSTWKHARAIEAVVLAATEPVPPAVLAQLVELPTDASRGAVRRARRGVRARRARVPARAGCGRLPLPDPSRRVRVRRAVRARRPDRAPVGPGARDAGDHRVQAADRAGADLGDPRRERRRDAEDVGRARVTSRRAGTSTRPATRRCSRPRRAFLERLGVDSLADLPPLADFVPESSLVEALERGLRGVDVEVEVDRRVDEPGETPEP